MKPLPRGIAFWTGEQKAQAPLRNLLVGSVDSTSSVRFRVGPQGMASMTRARPLQEVRPMRVEELDERRQRWTFTMVEAAEILA